MPDDVSPPASTSPHDRLTSASGNLLSMHGNREVGFFVPIIISNARALRLGRSTGGGDGGVQL